MECDTFTFDFLREAFPTIDIRVIKATVLEHGVDIESALTFLSSVSDELEDVKNVLPEDKLPARCNSRDTTHYGNAHLVENGETANAISRPPSDYHVDDELEATYADAATVRELSNSESHVSVEFLKEVLEDARRDKEIVSNLVKEISDLRAKADLERTAAERAKREAAVSGKEVLRKAEELREQISEKKQDNLMRMGEIHGEKAVLSTEARGLKLQFEQLKLQKSRVETVLVEIRERLEDCYQEAVKERLMAEEEGRMKLKLAQEILAEEEIAMAAVEEESKRLEIEADSCMQARDNDDFTFLSSLALNFKLFSVVDFAA
ncbi:hypothetical protein KP509_07G079500 [Ceratopteris richardii]|uniref:CUE domain-containing protein n=1 Tax=Ceratopteris richardii TaxID=49495 RepID=A0A8T2UJJ2_CERRI|nr:hypothetical protein KP509_07G079500 [Ceratopteris richardii]